MVRVLPFFVENIVGSHHIVHDGRFADLFAAELLLGRQVLAVIVA